jgi:outer membrane protein X
MKKQALLLVAALTALTATAQEFKPFKINLSLGYAHPAGKGAKGGFVYSLEPKIGLSDHFDLGLRLEQAFLAQSVTTVGNTTNADVKALTSGVVTATYLLGTGAIRPFVGVGGGVYALGETNVTFNGTTGGTSTTDRYVIDKKAAFGGLLRAGLKVGHFTATAEYNALGKTTGSQASTVVERQNSYLSVKIGVDLGGGRR